MLCLFDREILTVDNCSVPGAYRSPQGQESVLLSFKTLWYLGEFLHDLIMQSFHHMPWSF